MIQSLPTLKTNWCLCLMIKNYYQKWTLYVKTLLKKKKNYLIRRSYKDIDLKIFMVSMHVNLTCKRNV